MEKEVVKNHHHHSHNHNNNNNKVTPSPTSLREKHLLGDGPVKPPQSADFVLRWGNRKRLRCMKIQVKNDSAPVSRTTVRVDRRVVRSDNNNNNNNNSTSVIGIGTHPSNAQFNLRQRAASPAHPPVRILRNTEGGGGASGMKGHNSNNINGNNNNTNNNNNNININNNNNNNQNSSSNGGTMRGVLASPENGGRTASSETKGGVTSSGGGSEMVWPPKFVIALTNKEKEEDFLAIKGSKLPQRPKKRAKLIQRTLNLVSPGTWLCDLTLERYEVREKKISKKRPRGLKALGNYMESDSD